VLAYVGDFDYLKMWDIQGLNRELRPAPKSSTKFGPSEEAKKRNRKQSCYIMFFCGTDWRKVFETV
jgi:hypothetical protein